jgi:hypothetical protein
MCEYAEKRLEQRSRNNTNPPGKSPEIIILSYNASLRKLKFFGKRCR